MKLKNLLDQYIILGREYFESDNDDLFQEMYEAREKIRLVDKKVHRLVDNSLFMIIDDKYTHEQIYHVIEYLTGVQIEDEYLYQPVGTE